MIDISLLRESDSFEFVANNLEKRGVTRGDLEKLRDLDETWRTLQEQYDAIRAQKNDASDRIAKASPDEKQQIIADMQQASQQEKELAETLEEISPERDALWRHIPNLIQDDVPEGREESFEVVFTKYEEIPKPAFEQKDYITLVGTSIDLERATKVSGSRFVYILDELARLEIGLVSFIMDTLAPQGFRPVMPPVLIKEEAMRGMGYVEKGGDEIYQTQDDLYLVGTSEQSVGSLHMNETVEAPTRYVAFSPCFRREAGSHGKDVKGIMRLHQFDKVEMFSITTPDASNEEHGFLLEQQQAIMDALELPYRVIKLASQDLGAPSSKTYDIETWIPSEGRYRETHSTSNTTDFQARRLNIRVKNGEGKTVKAHMLNGTAVAMSRILIALIENHQQADGSIAIPKALHQYLPFTTISRA